MFNYIKNKLKLHVCTVSSLQLNNITIFFHFKSDPNNMASICQKKKILNFYVILEMCRPVSFYQKKKKIGRIFFGLGTVRFIFINLKN